MVSFYFLLEPFLRRNRIFLSAKKAKERQTYFWFHIYLYA